MRYRKHQSIVVIGLAFFLLMAMGARAEWNGQDDEQLFREAKILIFDKEWEQAQLKLEELLDEYPRSRYFTQALFYKGKCLMEQEGEERYALRVFREYLDHDERNDKLIEEAEIAIIDLAFRLFENGKTSYVGEIENRLDSRNRIVRYYAAVKMSFLEDKKIGLKAVPILQDILENESSSELRDRARIALLRIDPQSMDKPEKEYPRSKGKMLNLVIKSLKGKGPSFELAIPWALADLALGAIPDDAKEEIRKEGYNLDNIVKELSLFTGKVFEIRSDDAIIKIWIQ